MFLRRSEYVLPADRLGETGGNSNERELGPTKEHSLIRDGCHSPVNDRRPFFPLGGLVIPDALKLDGAVRSHQDAIAFGLDRPKKFIV
jgi:hypothetical protein